MKVRCTHATGSNLNYWTIGKVYDMTRYGIKCDDGSEFSVFASKKGNTLLKKWEKFSSSTKFEEVGMTKDDLRTAMNTIKEYCKVRNCWDCEIKATEGKCNLKRNSPFEWTLPETKSKAQLEIESLQAKKAEFDKEYDEKMARLKEEV